MLETPTPDVQDIQDIPIVPIVAIPSTSAMASNIEDAIQSTPLRVQPRGVKRTALGEKKKSSECKLLDLSLIHI